MRSSWRTRNRRKQLGAWGKGGGNGVGTGEGSPSGSRRWVEYSGQGPAFWEKGLMRVKVPGHPLSGEPDSKPRKGSWTLVTGTKLYSRNLCKSWGLVAIQVFGAQSQTHWTPGACARLFSLLEPRSKQPPPEESLHTPCSPTCAVFHSSSFT